MNTYVNLTSLSLSYKNLPCYKRIIGKWGMMRNSQVPYCNIIRRRGQNRLDKFYTLVIL